MPKIKKITKIEIKKGPKTIIKFREEPPSFSEESEVASPEGGVDVATQTPLGVSHQWTPNPFEKAGDGSITTPEGDVFPSRKEYHEHLKQKHKKQVV